MDKTRYYPEWKELAKVAGEWEYGSFHSHDEIAEILGIEKKTSKYYSYVQKVARILQLKQKVLENVLNKGYRIVDPHEHVEVSTEKVLKSEQYLQRALIIIEHTPEERLAEDDRKKHELHRIRIGRLYMMSKPEFDVILAHVPKRFQLTELKPKKEEKHETTENQN